MKVSVLMITYGHEKYIRQAIESVLNQQCDFDYELIIANDCSPDSSDEIITEIIKNHSKGNLIEYIKRSKNIGMQFNYFDAYQKSRGEYIANCEGDDYWTDPLKLQKQINFLKHNSDYGICFHNVTELNTFDESKNKIIPNVVNDYEYNIEDYILGNRTATCSIVFNKSYLKLVPDWFFKVLFGDLALILTIMYNSNAKGYVLKDNMGVYRIHENGIHGSLLKNNKSLIKAYRQHIQFTRLISKEFLIEKKYQKVILTKLKNTYTVLSRLYKDDNDGFNRIKANYWVKYYKLKLKSIR